MKATAFTHMFLINPGHCGLLQRYSTVILNSVNNVLQYGFLLEAYLNVKNLQYTIGRNTLHLPVNIIKKTVGIRNISVHAIKRNILVCCSCNLAIILRTICIEFGPIVFKTFLVQVQACSNANRKTGTCYRVTVHENDRKHQIMTAVLQKQSGKKFSTQLKVWQPLVQS